MDYLTTIKWYKWLIGGLIVLNLLSISAFWMYNSEKIVNPDELDSRNPVFIKERAMPQKSDKFLVNELGLNPKQAVLFKNERERHFNETSPLREEILLKRKQLNEAIFEKEVDSTRIYKLHQEILQLDNRIEKLKLEHFLELSSFCDTIQKEKIKLIFQDIILKDRKTPPRRKHNKNNY